jgi:hypothetical protein
MMPPLPITDVRNLARLCKLQEIQFNQTSRVLSFRSCTSTGAANSSARFNVYYSTGTVGTYLNHPRQGKTQLFRRNVSLDLLQDIFNNPRIHTDFGYQRTSCSSKRSNNIFDGDDNDDDDDYHFVNNKRFRTNSGQSISNGAELVVDEESAAKEQMQKLVAEKAALDKEMKEVQDILNDHEYRREEQRRIEKAEKERLFLLEAQRIVAEVERIEAEAEALRAREVVRTNRGTGGSWGGLRESNDFRHNFDRFSTCIAIGDDTHITLYEDGRYAYSSGMPDGIIRLLRTRSPSHPAPDYVALGSQDRYYIHFTNGKSEWVGPESMTTNLQNCSKKVKCVAFGEGFDAYCIVFNDGDFCYEGIPYGLDAKIKARRNKCDVEKITLGPEGEWGLWTKNGRAWWGGISPALTDSINTVHNDGNTITDLLFGGDGSYFIRYR